MLNQLKRFMRGERTIEKPVSAISSGQALPERSDIHISPMADVPDPSLKDAYLTGWFQHDTKELVKGFPIAADDSVLDIGCGDGTFINFCAQLGAEVFFADIDAEKIAGVSQRLQNSTARAIHPLVTDGNPIPLPDEHVNKLIAMEVLEHVDEPAKFMKELARVAKPGASFLLTVPAEISEKIQKDLAPDHYFKKPNHINIFTESDFRTLVSDAGLVVEKTFSYGAYWTLWWSFFWICKQDLDNINHPLMQQWARTWHTLLETPEGENVKAALDKAIPKSMAIIARKPLS